MSLRVNFIFFNKIRIEKHHKVLDTKLFHNFTRADTLKIEKTKKDFSVYQFSFLYYLFPKKTYIRNS